ncbi:MAG: hypothetical protein DRP90_02220 [Planctomycetota bacterium]|nr:MAG: hypothetical protein DRP90_02220 [Planctomycetota bacterium]
MSERKPDSARIRKLLDAYADGELSPAAELEVERALVAHPELSAELERIRELKALLASAAPEPSAEKLEKLSASVAAALESPPAASRRSGRVPGDTPAFRKAFLAIAAVLLLLLLPLGYYSRHRKDAPSAKVEEVEVGEGSGVKVISPEGASYSVIRITTHERDAVSVREIETAEGYSCEVVEDPDSGDAVIRLIPPAEEDDRKE